VPQSYPSPSPKLIELLRSTLKRLEEELGMEPNDPKLLEFKDSLLRSIAEMEVRKQDEE
jgi:hypothetical protein